ncbi:MAG: hypothetical protein ABID38_01740 [Candidatus Diapherotrites archaeon]
MEIQADIERLELDSPDQKKRMALIAEFLGLDPKKKAAPVDSILFSDILNYIDFRTVVSSLSKYLKPGGRIIILNKPGRGISERFSERGVKENSELIEFLDNKNGFEIEHLTPHHNAEKYPQRQDVAKLGFIILVARKK